MSADSIWRGFRKIDNGVVSVSSLWADERVYYPVDLEPYTPATYFAKGKNDPQFRTKLKIALQLVERALQENIPFRAVVADSFYGEDRALRRGLRKLLVPYVMALKPSHDWWHPEGVAGSLQDVAHEAGWVSAEQPGQWVGVTRTIRSGSTQPWWALEIVAGPYGPDKTDRAIVASTDPQTLPDATTWYLVTNLPAPTDRLGTETPLPPASLEEVLRLYGLRMWVEQSYKQLKHALGWSQYQVRSDKAIRRHWQLVCCAFSFCWYHASHPAVSITPASTQSAEPEAPPQTNVSADRAGTGKKKPARNQGLGHRCPGQWRCGRYADGWSPGSCCGAIGVAGLNCPRLHRCNSCSVGLSRGKPSHSTVQLDPRPQTTAKVSTRKLIRRRCGIGVCERSQLTARAPSSRT
jgi:hypothetical protein